ncbi:MAG TPA: carbonic anhydrase family protein, partial [Rhodocyclaceae bacterium]|nr:carbonic anhydrase family protein [Rhodocyclaceae bacterium]
TTVKVISTLMGLALCSFGASTHAAPRPAQAWALIATNQGEKVELDKARIGRMPNGQTAAWSRLTLGFDLPDADTGIRYTAIEALNSYDCVKKEFSTLKRVYLSDGKAVREEKIASPRSMEISAGSFEDKLLGQVCKPRSVGEMQGVAELAAQLMAPAAPAESKPSVMSADMRTLKETKKADVVAVADKPAQLAPTPVPDVPSKPRMIDLPKIDKSQVEDPYKTDKPEAAAKSPAKSAEAKKPATAPAADPAMSTGALSRAEIERQLATFGPRKAKPKKKMVTPAAAPQEIHLAHGHWSYEGDGGPANWAKLEDNFNTCSSGKRQSPIDIRDGIKVDLEPIKFNYGTAQFSVIDNGHTVQVNIAEGNTIRIMERTYQLLQFHFHKPSEERVNGRTYDMVAHLVHKDDDGRLAVVAVLIEKGSENPVIQTIWNNLPLEQGMLVSPSVTIDLARLLPENRSYWTYMGSLTTPPCTEGVLWMVMKQPVQLSPEQVSIFGRLYRNNARPIQPSNDRLIKESR